MSIKIETERIVTDKNEYAYRVKKIYALGKKELPEAYLNQEYSMYKLNPYLIGGGYSFLLEEGRTYNIRDFNKRIDVITKCGEELRRVNNEIKEKKKNWHGTETFVI